MKKLIFLAAVLIAACASSCDKDSPVITPPVIGGGDTSTSSVEVGKTLPAWTEGEMDIHFINTTSGESMFIIFPDGTQMLIDAAGSQVATGTVNSTTNTGIRSRWDPTKQGILYGDFISRYIRHCMEWTGNNGIDYVVLTHFHNDHFGGAAGLPASANSSTYTKQSLPLVLDNFKVGMLADRGWPDYNYPFDMATKSNNAANCANYITAVKWHVANKGLKVERFKAGSNSQFPLLRKAGDYSNVRIQNLAVNGEVWTGSGTATTSTFPALADISVLNPASVAAADKCPEENHCSAMMKISYGSFDFFAGGDAQYDGVSSFAWKDIETPVAKVCGQVEVMKADHHGTSNTQGTGFKDTAWAMKYLAPQVWVVNSWTDGHPRQTTFESVTNYLGAMDVYITNTCDAQKLYGNYASKYKGGNGHVVVRVDKGGSTYHVYTLTDSDEKYTVTAASKEYKSR